MIYNETFCYQHLFDHKKRMKWSVVAIVLLWAFASFAIFIVAREERDKTIDKFFYREQWIESCNDFTGDEMLMCEWDRSYFKFMFLNP